MLADPLRQQMIDLLRLEPCTVKQLAGALDVGPKKLYYHVNLLLEHDLIRVVGTRMVSGILEKQYRATAYLLILDDMLLAGPPPARDENRDAVMSTILDLTRNDIRNSVRSGLLDLGHDAPTTSSMLLEWSVGHMTAEEAGTFYQRLEALCKDFPPLRSDTEDVRAYRLLVTLFPTTSHTPTGGMHDEGEEDHR